MSLIEISNETLSIQVHVSGVKCIRDKGKKHVAGMKHVVMARMGLRPSSPEVKPYIGWTTMQA